MDWIHTFFEQLYAGNIGQAIELKNKNFPSKIYRYRTFIADKEKPADNNIEERKQEILYGKLYVAHPDELDDPFEVTTFLDSNDIWDYISDSSKKIFSATLKQALPESVYNRIFFSTNWKNQLIEYFANTCNNANLHSILCKILMPLIEKNNSAHSIISRHKTRLACFTTSCKNNPMWYYYTGMHEGICLEYNIENELFKRLMYPVCYVDKLPNLVKTIEKRENSIDIIPYELYLAMYKLKEWSFEQEWRLILDGFYLDHKKVSLAPEYKGYTIDFIKPSKIICGLRMNNYHKEKIYDIASDAGIDIVDAKRTEYGLQIP